MNDATKKYLKDCKKIFPFVGKNEKIFLEKLHENINDHIKENHDITYQELTEQIGTPKDIMISYIQNCDNMYIIDKMNIKKIIKKISIVICTLLITSLSIVCYFEWKTIEESRNQKIIKNEITIEDN